MGQCIVCSTATPGNYKMCTTCYALAQHSPCKPCTLADGRHPGCQDHCDKRAKWLMCHKALMKLEKDRRSMLRNRKFFNY